MTYYLTLDELKSVWIRSEIKVHNCTSDKEAIQKILDESTDVEYMHRSTLYETEYPIEPTDENPCTLEIMDTSGEIIYYNSIK